jgi:hypothetical protein
LHAADRRADFLGKFSGETHEPFCRDLRLMGMGRDETSGQTGESTMIRKFAIAFAAIATLGATSIATAPVAEAKPVKVMKFGHHHHHGHFGHYGFYGAAPLVAYAGTTCWRRVWVETSYGPRRRLVNVCE